MLEGQEMSGDWVGVEIYIGLMKQNTSMGGERV